ncbi:hypothetical protein [Brevundimonas sp. FT23042]|uniref:hypothetical protein n=1 Tax=Brevundimonas sp. FT23042 TaxID=3393749 RepID=UPI003B58776A
MRVARGLIGVILALTLAGLGACASAPMLGPETLTSIREGRQSAILMAFKPYQGMGGARVTFLNVGTRRLYDLRVVGGDNWVNAGPEMVAVPPGRYRIYSGVMGGGSFDGTLPLLGRWFDDFEVGAGEIVDVGALNVEGIEVRSMSGIADSLVYGLLTLDPARRDHYLVYSVDYSAEVAVQHMLDTKYPDLGLTPVRRPLQTVIDRSAFERAIVEAYMPNADGSLPTREAAEARVEQGLRSLTSQTRPVVASPVDKSGS